ncbi:MAG: methyltransferase domain-containing protein [Bdellovibrionaceae bacterium]|nr:methyltransferase domain-containing protein [Pseudobdellovibrionaceae bacterium]
MAKAKYFFEKLVKISEPHAWDEQAIPSYTHSVSVVRSVFWQRVQSAFSCHPSGVKVLDFGCGVGALIPLLAGGYRNVFAFDLDPRSLEQCSKLCSELKISNVQFLKNLGELVQTDAGCIDTIFALDVLEHIDELDEVLVEFKKLLKPNGHIVVSSPTENWIYKFMRNFGGKGFQGEFHVRAAKEVEAALANHFHVRLIRRIFPVFTFFRIVDCTQKS